MSMAFSPMVVASAIITGASDTKVGSFGIYEGNRRA